MSINRFRSGILRAAPAGAVDREKRVIPAFAVITKGPALGHGVWIDQTTLSQVVALGNDKVNGVKSRYTHPGLCADGLGKHLGWVKGFALQGDMVRADLLLSKVADDSPDGRLGSYVMELAEEDPESFGASIVFEQDKTAMKEFANQNQKRVGEYNGGEIRAFKSPDPENKADLPHLRIKSLHACDMVGDPAANPSGLFSTGSELPERAESVLSWLLEGAPQPDAFALGELAPEKVKEFFGGFLLRHGLAITRKEQPVKYKQVVCADCKQGHPAEEGKFGSTTCPYCGKSFDMKPEDKKEEPKAVSTFPPAPAAASVPALSAAPQVDRASIVKEESEKARQYGKDFEGVLTAAGFKTEDRESFRSKYYGRELADVKEFAALWVGKRTQPVGEGNGAFPVATEGEKKPAVDVTELSKRFAEVRGVRECFGVKTNNPESKEYQEGLKRYLEARAK